MAQTTPEQLLDDLLSEDAEHARLRAQAAYDSAAGPFANRLVLFGAGGFGRMIKRKLRDLHIEPLAFADNNPNPHGAESWDLVCYAIPEERLCAHPAPEN